MIYIISGICTVLLVAAIVCLWEGHRECKVLRLTSYDIGIQAAEDFGELRILMLADLHNNVFPDDNAKLLRYAADCKPDVIILAGDMIVCHADERAANRKTAELIRKLSAIAPVYYGLGNHEKGAICHIRDVGDMWENYMAALGSDKDDRITIMDNRTVRLTFNQEAFDISGLDLGQEYYKRMLVKPLTNEALLKMLGEAKRDAYHILIAHNPDYFHAYADWGADLILSGHNHGGLVRLPFLGGVISPRLHPFPKYDRGVFRYRDSTMILSGGMGAHSLKIRVNNEPEIILIRITNTNRHESE